MNIKIIDEDGNFFCYAPTLAKSPFIQREDFLSDVPADLGKQIYLDLSPLLLPRLNLSSQELGNLVSGFSNNYVFTGVTLQPHSEETLSHVYVAAANRKKKLNLKVTSPAFEKYIFGYAGTDPILTRSPDRWITVETTETVALGDIAFSLGRALDKDLWTLSENHNLLLYRAVQHHPKGYFLPDDPSSEKLRTELLEISDSKLPAEKKPVANLVLGPSADLKFTIPQQFSGITNALTANGFDIRVTFETFMDKADLYYVVGREAWLDNLKFFDALLRLMDSKRSHVYVPVILHPWGEIRNLRRWKKIRKHFHIPDTEEGWISEIPAFLKERGRKIEWGGGVLPKGAGMTFLRSEPIRHAGGNIALSELVGTQTLALILQSGNHFLVNGYPLKMEAGYVLSRLAGGALKAPTLAYVSAGKFRTAAFALEETYLSLKLPALDLPREWRMTVYGADGIRAEETAVPGSEAIDARIKAGELLLIEAVLP